MRTTTDPETGKPISIMSVNHIDNSIDEESDEDQTVNWRKFLINESKIKTKTGWKWLCRVFLIDESCEKWFADITERIAELSNRQNDYDWINLTIHYWSWTWAMVISNVINVNWWKSEIINISIF